MLVIVWETMNESIQRLQAEDNLSAYTVAVLSSPAPDQDSLSKRQRVINEWRQLTFGKAKKAIEVTVAQLSVMLRQAFGEEISDSTGRDDSQ